MPQLNLAAVKELFEEHTKALKNEINELKKEVASLREELSKKDADATHPPLPTSKKDFSDVVRTSVESVLQQEQARSDVIIVNFKDDKKDTESVGNLCEEIGCPSIPVATHRLGQERADKPRLLKATFHTPFDARAFNAKVDEAKKSGNISQPRIRCRPGRTKEEQVKFSTLAAAAYKLNTKAKEDKLNESYSLRPNGMIWKFSKNERDQWRRVADWEYKPENANSGK